MLYYNKFHDADEWPTKKIRNGHYKWFFYVYLHAFDFNKKILFILLPFHVVFK